MLSYAILEHLLRSHPDRPQPRLHQLRPSGYRKLCAPQPKRMSALGVQMHRHWNPSLLQRNVVSQRVVYVVHVSSSACSKNVGGVWLVTGISGVRYGAIIGHGGNACYHHAHLARISVFGRTRRSRRLRRFAPSSIPVQSVQFSWNECRARRDSNPATSCMTGRHFGFCAVCPPDLSAPKNDVPKVPKPPLERAA